MSKVLFKLHFIHGPAESKYTTVVFVTELIVAQ